MSTTRDLKIIRHGTQDGHEPVAQPMQSAISLYAGQIALTRGGYLIQPDTSVQATDIAWGILDGTLNGAPAVSSPITNGSTSAGGNGMLGIQTGTFYLRSGSGADALTQADVGATVYVIDGNTVGKTDGGSTRPVAGRLVAIGSGQYAGMVAVKIGNDQSTGSP
jgi:hypothetical protein